MEIHNAKHLAGFASEHGEIVFEFFGTAAGHSQAHSLAQIVIPPGKSSLKHYHPVAEESYYILCGTADLELDGETAALSPGDNVVIRAEQIHQIRNAGDVDLVFLAVCVPAWTPDNSVFVD